MKNKLVVSLFALTLLAAKDITAQTVVVTDDNTYVTGQASSVLDVKSITKGFLAPRMTAAQRIAITSPADGLLVYQTDGVKGFYFYNASAWTILSAGTGTQWLNSGSNIYYTSGNVGVGISNPTVPLSVKDTLEIRRTGAMSELLFANTAGSGDFRIAGDGGDVFWQGGGGRNLQMGSYWGMILGGDRQTTTIPAFSAGVGNTGVLILGQRDASVPLAIQANSASQTANLTEWRSSSATLNVVDEIGNFGIGVTSPASKLHVSGTNPLTLNGVQTGLTSDSLLTITSGTVRKLPFTAVGTGPGWALTGNTGTSYLTNFLGTTDNKSLRFRTNNTQRFILDSLGNAGIGAAPAFTNGTFREKLLVDAGTTSSYNAIVARGSINNYLQLNIQNQSAGANASADIVATADNGNESVNYIDMGINSSANTQGIMGDANDAYLYTTGNDLLIGTANAATSLVFMTGGTTQSTNERMRIDGNGKVGIGTNSPTTDLTLYQSTGGAASSKGFRFMGNSIGGTSSGTGFGMALGYNTTGNKQLWLGDADYLGNSTGSFLRYSVSSGIATFDAVAGDNSVRRPIALGDAGDPQAAIILGSDYNATAPGSFIWGNGNMAVGNSYRVNAAPANGLIVQGNTGIGTTSPTAALHLRAGTSTASTGAPLKFTSGTSLTTPEDGAVEFDGTNYFASAGGVRYTLAKTLTATATLNFPSTAIGSSSTLTITVTGAADGDVVQIGVPATAILTNSYYTAYVSGANTVTIRFNNTSGFTSQDPNSGTFRASIIKY